LTTTIGRMVMQLIQVKNIAVPQGNPVENAPRREVLRLSDLDVQGASDLSGMFGMWFEADHCDKDDR